MMPQPPPDPPESDTRPTEKGPDRALTILVAVASNSLDGHICTQLPYTDGRSGWKLVMRPFPWTEPSRPDLRPDGCLAWATHELELNAVRSLGVPTVNMSSGLESTELPTVTNDNREIGRLAARHLLHDCAMPNLGFVNISAGHFAWSHLREEGFTEVAGQAGIICHRLARNRRPGLPCAMTDNEMEEWLAALPKPVGVMAADDWLALGVVRACANRGILIPSEVAVIGANNDLIGSMTVPSVSSVDRNQSRVVLEASALLDRLMRGERGPTTRRLISPLGVVKRDSTNTLAVGDRKISAVVEYIRANVEEPFNIKTLSKRFGVSSRTLARGFAHWMHCRPTDYVARVRLARAKELLREPHKLSIVAKVSGFTDEKQLRTVFKRAMGMSPNEYRRQLMTNSSITR